MSTNEQLRTALSKVIDPELRKSITELNMVPHASVEGNTARVTVLLTIAGCPMRSTIEADVRAAALSVPGISQVDLELGVMSRNSARNCATRWPDGAPRSPTRIP
ncbi:iron-sulfur cluster assembly protein [Arthrobacter sp. JCM 19049]|uniref:iron-sulfur cluster assembly protein n=1 Tax=Arthrobacter sp. JCM 19049 TaxID=1460643 RepID=UPI000A4F0798